MAAIVSSAVSVKSAGDILTLTASAATGTEIVSTCHFYLVKVSPYSGPCGAL
jgi:hypothetical protein